MSDKDVLFVDTLWQYYNENARVLPWRVPELDGTFDPYKILVSELMLQQTQVGRVVPKYTAFLEKFPSSKILADAPLSDVLEMWKGLGYSRRAKYLHEAGKYITLEGFPQTVEALMTLKGVGRNTAAAVLVYSHNEPYPFVETNVRTVYIHHFFNDKNGVPDTAIIPIIERTIDRGNPREFMWAVMDYGTHLKSSGVKNNTKSKHYTQQSRFEGSVRQMRGEILRLAQAGAYINSLEVSTDTRFDSALEALITDGLVVVSNNQLHIAN